jgi:hypothetical protein
LRAAILRGRFIYWRDLPPARLRGLHGIPSESVGLSAHRAQPRAIGVRRRAVSRYRHGDDYLLHVGRAGAAEGDRLAAGARGRISESARLVRTAVWDDVVIDDDVSLADCVVADGARIPAGARYERCAIVPASACGPTPGQRVENALLIAPF